MQFIKHITILYIVAFSSATVYGNFGSDTSKQVLPEIDYEYVPDLSYAEVSDRLSCMESEVPLEYNKVVKSFIDYFTVRDRAYTKLMMQRVNLYFPIFEYYLEKHGLPEELKYLSIIESGLNPTIRSRVGAAGLWQFMPIIGLLPRDHDVRKCCARQHQPRSMEIALLGNANGLTGCKWQINYCHRQCVIQVGST